MRIVQQDDCGAAALSLLVLGTILILLSPFAVAAADLPLGASEVDAAAGSAARVAARQSSPDSAVREAERTARRMLEAGRCEEGTVRVAVDASTFGASRTPSGAPEAGLVTVLVECDVATGERLHLPWLPDSTVSAEAVEAVDPFRTRDAR